MICNKCKLEKQHFEMCWDKSKGKNVQPCMKCRTKRDKNTEVERVRKAMPALRGKYGTWM